MTAGSPDDRTNGHEGHDHEGRDDGQTLSRRRFLAGSAILLGGSSAIVESTEAEFLDTGVTNGTVQIDGDPTIQCQITDNSVQYGNRFDIQYQVQWMSNFDELQIEVENVDNPAVTGASYTRSSMEGSVSYPGRWWDNGNPDETYRFTFEAYTAGSSSPVVTRVVEDVADGSDSGDGDLGNADDPVLDSYQVIDDTSGDTTSYTVEYQLSNVTSANFSEVAVTFDDTEIAVSGTTNTSTEQPTGSVSYSIGWGITVGDEYEITIDVRNANGVAVDSATVTDVADGTDP